MKKNLFSLLAMAALAVVFTACSQNEELSSSDQKSVFVKLDIGQGTRAIQAPFGNNRPTVSSLRIYFHNNTPGSILKMVAISSTTTPSINDLINGAKISDVPSSATHVTVFGNIPSSILTTVPTAGTIASVKSTMLGVETQTTAEHVLLNGSDGVLQSASGAGAPTWISTLGGVGAGDLYAEVTIAPAFARVEIEGMKTKTGSAITGYSLQGIFLNNIYTQMQLDGTVPSSVTLQNNGPDATKYLQDVTGSPLVYPSANNGIFHNWFAPSLVAALTGGIYEITAGAGMRWAYQVIPNANTAANDQLQIIMRLTNVTGTGLTYTGDQFLTIRGFLDSATGTPVTIQPGKIYTISTADFEFDENDITDTPVTNAVGVYLKVTVTPWSPVAVKPNL